MASLINLTPHPIRVYDVSVPDQINPADHEPILTVEPSTEHPPARLGEIDLGTQYLGLGVPVEYVEWLGAGGGLVNRLPERQDGVWLVVPLVVALTQTYLRKRGDLLVPYGQVRNMEGTVVGCRSLARPV